MARIKVVSRCAQLVGADACRVCTVPHISTSQARRPYARFACERTYTALTLTVHPAFCYCRLREMREQAIGSVRYVAVSATIPNVRDLAEWLGAPSAGIMCFGGCWEGARSGGWPGLSACLACLHGCTQQCGRL